MARTQKKKGEEEGIKLICRNRRAFHDYHIDDKLECGIVLTGTEVKSLREGGTSLEDSYARVEGSEVWLIGCDIPEYTYGNRLNHKPKRPRKLLLHRREIAQASPTRPRSAATRWFPCGCTSAKAGPRSRSPWLAARRNTTSAKPRRSRKPSAKSVVP